MSFEAVNESVNSPATREQLLEAAAEVFTEAGFRAATVREICQRAGANVAAVNYHFGDKQALYSTVLKYSHRVSLEKYPPNLGLASEATPEERLEAFIRSFLLRLFSKGPESRLGKLMSREMIEPTAALDEIINENILPMAGTLFQIISDLLGPKARPDTLRLCGMSVVSQILFYHHCRPVISRMFPDLQFDETGAERLAKHINQFCLAAMREFAQHPPAA